MLVKVLQFGTNWWARLGHVADDPGRLTRHAAYYNSTGVRCGRKVRRHWIMPGLIRFNGVGDFNPRHPNRSLGETFLCSNVDFLFGGNRLLFRRKMPKHVMPDSYLVVISRELHGSIHFSASDWRSPETHVIAATELRDMQETMLLMKTGDWVKTVCGFWQLCARETTGSDVGLELRGEPGTG